MAPPSPLLADLRRLGLQPGAAPSELKAAWRRAVSQLHPDRTAGSATDGRSLAEVNAAFDRLESFHRRYGRLPAASDLGSSSPSPTKPRFGRALSVAAAAAAAAFVLWPHAGEGDGKRAGAGTSVEPADITPESLARDMWTTALPGEDARTDAGPASRGPRRIELGMTGREVEALAGPPLFRSPERWEYGPSLVRFAHGRVAGWHSSPLRPLPVATPHAPVDPVGD